MAFFSSFTSFFNSFYSTNSTSNENTAMEKKKSPLKRHQNGSIIQRKTATTNQENGHTQNGLEKRFLGNGSIWSPICNNSPRPHEKITSKESDEGNGVGGWFLRQQKPWWAWLVVWILKLGPMPRHIAFVMDGNRRFARQSNQCTVLDGHQRGFEQLTKVLDWCDWFELSEITVYAFSIENFKRPEEEVQGLMELAEQKFKQLLESRDQLAERKLRIRFFGNRKLLPPQIQQLIGQIEALADGKECGTSLNICLAYTSTDEITRAFEEIRQKVQSGQIQEDEIDRKLINAHLDTRDSLPLDMFVRTSEMRLSDFMLFQIRNSTYLHFEPNVLWPEFCLWHLLRAILHFQMARVQLAQWQQKTWFPRMEILREFYDGEEEENNDG